MKSKIIVAAIGAFMLLANTIAFAQKDSMVVIKTEYGDVVLKLYNETPKHRDNFMKLVRGHFYDSLLFHRVIKDFMIQGGDPTSKRAKPEAMLGNGENGYTIPAEFNAKYVHKKGALAAARMGDNVNPLRNSSGCQFYIVQGRKFTEPELTANEQNINNQLKQQIFSNYINKPENASTKSALLRIQKNQDTDSMKIMNDKFTAIVEAEYAKATNFKYTPEQIQAYSTIGGTPHLDMGYTVFGEVVSGLEVIDKIAEVEKGTADRPKKDVRMFVEVYKPKK
jgi:cyclophilin family peptidyl-prolyl cis-trans isomerase